jgi:hypothetical protein
LFVAGKNPANPAVRARPPHFLRPMHCHHNPRNPKAARIAESLRLAIEFASPGVMAVSRTR